MFDKKQYETMKQSLRNGGFVYGDRGTGRTTALLEVMFELGPERCILIVANSHLIRHVERLWQSLLDRKDGLVTTQGITGLKAPRMIPAQCAELGLRGQRGWVFCDDLKNCIANDPEIGDRGFLTTLRGAIL